MPSGEPDRRRIGILGGTFDPPHLGHLLIAETARVALDLETVMFLPAGEPWLKSGQRITPARHRLHMVQLAVADNPGFCVSDCEVRRTGATYTVDTLRQLRCGYSPRHGTVLHRGLGRPRPVSPVEGTGSHPAVVPPRGYREAGRPRGGNSGAAGQFLRSAGRRRGGVRGRAAGRLQRVELRRVLAAGQSTRTRYRTWWRSTYPARSSDCARSHTY